jgi:uncharacterized CHY-type Zn-finger protein
VFTSIDNITITTVDLSGVFTVLADISTDVNGIYTVLTQIDADIFATQTILCDKFFETWTILDSIEQLIINDFNQTWTILDEITTDISGVFTSIDNITITTVDLSGIFTALADISADVSGIYTVLTQIDSDIFATQTILCDKFFETWTILDSIEQLIISDFNQTWTILNEITTDINSVFTVLDNLIVTVTMDLSEIFTVLDQIDSDILATQTILCDKFFQTWTILDEISTDISGVFTSIDNITITTVDLSGIFTTLADISTDVNGIYTVLTQIDADILATQTILCDKFFETWTILDGIEQLIISDFNQTWTILNEITTDISGVFTSIDNITITTVDLSGIFTALADISADFNGIYTVLDQIDADIFATQTILCDKFFETWTILDSIEQLIISDFNQTWTILDEITTDISSIFTSIDNITITTVDLSGIFTALADISNDMNGIYTVLDQIDADIFATQTILCDKFFQTWTILDSLVVTASIDLSTIFTVLNVIDAALCSPTRLISQVDIGATTFTIAAPGYYIFEENIVFSPSFGQPAIEITSDNVIVDLCGKSFSQTNTTTGVNGFRIPGGTAAAPRNNVTVRNGIVKDFSRAGVVVGTNAINSANTAAEYITIHDLSCVNCKVRGIEFLGASSAAPITKSSIQHCLISECCNTVGADICLNLVNTQDIDVQHLEINNNGAAALNLIGVNIQTSTKCIFDDIEVGCNFAATFTAFVLNVTQDSLFTSCNILTNTATSAFTGFGLIGGAVNFGNTLSNCQVLNNLSTNGPIIGFGLFALVTRNQLNRCVANNNLVSGAIASAHCYGFYFDQPTFCIVELCQAANNRSTGNGTTNICAGFNVGTSGVGTTGTKNSTFSNNTAAQNNGFSDARSFGLRAVSLVNGNTGNAYVKNIAVRNGPTTPTSENQIVADGGAGSNPGGVPLGSVRSRTISNLNGQNEEFSNVRII